MQRIIVVDDSSSSRAHVAALLEAAGYLVEPFADGATAAQRAFSHPPDAVVTDLMMEKMSGVQLCRLLRSDSATAAVPIVLLTATDDHRSRFWARSAGASAYLTKVEASAIPQVVAKLVGTQAASVQEFRSISRDQVEARLARLMDAALYDSVISGEVRALANAESLEMLVDELANTLSGVVAYRWFAVQIGSASLLLSVSGADAHTADVEARDALSLSNSVRTTVLPDARASVGPKFPPLAYPIALGRNAIGKLVVAPSRRACAEDGRLVGLVALELAGPLRVQVLAEDSRRQATTDALTGLPNRRAFLSTMTKERARCDRHALPFSLLLIDIDHFKSVNDTHGHAAGDAVLVHVASVLAASLRTSDQVARWGGEEFVVALPHTGSAGARISSERLRRAVAEATIIGPGGGTLNVTASIGAVSAEGPWTFDDLSARADKAMYVAKSRGRNRVEVAEGATTMEGLQRTDPSELRGVASRRSADHRGPSSA